MVNDKSTKISIFILGAHSLAVHIGVAWRRRSTNRHVSRRTVPRLDDHEQIEPHREDRINVVLSQQVDVPRRQPKTVYGWGSSRRRQKGRSRLLGRLMARQLSPKRRTSCPWSPYSVEEEDFSCGSRYATRLHRECFDTVRVLRRWGRIKIGPTKHGISTPRYS